MTAAEWTPDLLVNHELLDRQHAEIFRCLAVVAQWLEGPPAALDEAMAALADALVGHLAAEERIMNEALYPERVRHRSAHELFMADFLQLREELRTAGVSPAVVDWVQRRLPDWLRFHISVNDVPLGLWLARRRPQPRPLETLPPKPLRRPS